jgi:hypothetical protein
VYTDLVPNTLLGSSNANALRTSAVGFAVTQARIITEDWEPPFRVWIVPIAVIDGVKILATGIRVQQVEIEVRCGGTPIFIRV